MESAWDGECMGWRVHETDSGCDGECMSVNSFFVKIIKLNVRLDII